MEVVDISDSKQMGTTGSSDKVALNSALPDMISRVKEYSTVPLAVGFGVSTREHYNTVVDAGAEGVVIGSRLVSVIKEAPPTQVAAKVEEYCRSISLKGQLQQDNYHSQTEGARRVTKPVQRAGHNGPLAPNSTSETTVLPPRFGGAKIWMKREDLFVSSPSLAVIWLTCCLAITRARIRSTML